MRYAERTGTWRTPAGHEAVFAYRDGTSDWNTIQSCLVNDEYSLPRGIEGIAVDVGAHIGAVAIAVALDNPGLSVIAVEPVPDNLRLLALNVRRNSLARRVTVVEGAAVGPRTRATSTTVRWGFTGSEAAEHHAFIGNSSLYEGHSPELVRVPVWRLPPNVAWLKIDIEGGEFDVLRDRNAKDIPVIVGEGHAVAGTPQDLASLLPGHDVTFTGNGGAWGFLAVLR